MGVFDKLAKITIGTDSDPMGQAVEDMVSEAITRRRSHERRWYDNNFFDDGYHFRVVSRKTGRVIDTAGKNAGYVERAIPRASRQIRGVGNLLFAAEPYPVVYPERISMSQFQTNGQLDQQAYEQEKEMAKQMARKQGRWLSTEWEDEQGLNIKLVDMILKAARNSVSYLQVYSDAKKQKIITDVLDGFDLILFGELDELQKVPFIVKTKPMDYNEAKNSPLFDEAKAAKLVPDNKYATSEIKDAYMRTRYGSKSGEEGQNTIMIKETFIKEYLTSDNWEQAVKLAADNGAMEGKSKGDMIMRQLFSAGGVTLADSYIDYDNYPFADLRFEPGPLYQVPFIERFIPQNKSIDIIVTRLEKWVNSMVVGIYQKRKGENFQITNMPGGQVMEYEQTPLTQMNGATVGSTPFNVIQMMDKYIEEQGASTSVLGQIPAGVKASSAIENLQQQEYANLKIPTLMLKKCIKQIAELMLERADKDFMEPVEVSSMEDGEPQYFDVIGQRGLELSQKVGKPLPPEVVPLKRKTKVRIEIEPGLGLTMAGKKEAMEAIIDRYLMLYKEGFMSPDAMAMIIKRFTETFGYGSTEELMEAVENGVTQGQMSEDQMKQMQIAMLTALKDSGAVGPQMDKKLVDSTKVGVLSALKDSGLADSMQQSGQLPISPTDLDADFVKIYKDAPLDIRRQIEEKLGLQPSVAEKVSPQMADTATKLHSIQNSTDQTDIQREASKQKAASTTK